GNYRLFLIDCVVALLAVVAGWAMHFTLPLWFWLFILIVALFSFSRFMWFLLIFSGFWIVFWQEFVALPLYLRGYVNPTANIDLLLAVDPAVVIAFTIVVS